MLLKDKSFSDALSEDLIFFFETNIGSTEKKSSVREASKAVVPNHLATNRYLSVWYRAAEKE